MEAQNSFLVDNNTEDDLTDEETPPPYSDDKESEQEIQENNINVEEPEEPANLTNNENDVRCHSCSKFYLSNLTNVMRIKI